MFCVNTDVIPTREQIWAAQSVECVLGKHECVRKTILKVKYWAELPVLITTIQITCLKALLQQNQCSKWWLRYSLVQWGQLCSWLSCWVNLTIQDELLNTGLGLFTYASLLFLGSKSSSEALSWKHFKLISHANSSAKLRPHIFLLWILLCELMSAQLANKMDSSGLSVFRHCQLKINL